MKNCRLFLLFPILLAACSGGSSDEGGPGTDACDLLSSRAKIVNGTSCETTTSPIFRVSIEGTSCTGTLITPSKVLTAAHCVYNIKNKVTLAQGTISPDKMSVFQADSILPVALVTKVNAHPDFVTDFIRIDDVYDRSESVEAFVAGVLSNGLADVAVLDLDRSLLATPQPILVSSAPIPGEIFGIFGYGATDGSEPFATSELNSGRMQVENVGRDNVTAIFRDGGSNTCFGDSGGPALKAIGVPDIIGTTAIGSTTNCASGEVSLFTLLSSPRLGNFVRRVAPKAEFE